MWSSYIYKDMRGRCHECDGCMMCQDPKEPKPDEWDEDEDIKRDYEEYQRNY